MNAWEPNEKDVQWLKNLVDKLKIGGFWIAPSYGVIFKKIDESTLEIQQPLVVTPDGTKMIDRTMKVGKKAGITVKKIEAVVVILPPMKVKDEKENLPLEGQNSEV